MRRVFWAAVAVGLGVLPALAAPPELAVKGPDKPEPCKLVTVTAETTAKVVKWKVIGDATAEFDSGGRKVFLVGKGKVTVLAVAASDTGELSEFKDWVGEFGAKPDDVTPPPADPLVKAFQAAFDADPAPDKRERLRVFSQCMDDAAGMAADAKYATAGDLEGAVRAACVQRVGVGQLPGLGKAVGEYLSKSLPAVKDDPLAPAARDKAAAGYKAVAAALKGVK